MAMVENPTFTTEAGIVLELKPIPYVLMKRFDIEYKNINPLPEPPFREVKVVGVATKQYDFKDEYYQQQMAVWQEKKEDAEITFLLSRGVINKIPDNWQPDPDTVSDKPSASQLRSLWVGEQLITVQDLAGVQEAITSLMTVTQEAVEAEEKK